MIAGFLNHQHHQRYGRIRLWDLPTCSSIDHFRLICRHGLDSWQPNATNTYRKSTVDFRLVNFKRLVCLVENEISGCLNLVEHHNSQWYKSLIGKLNEFAENLDYVVTFRNFWFLKWKWSAFKAGTEWCVSIDVDAPANKLPCPSPAIDQCDRVYARHTGQYI